MLHLVILIGRFSLYLIILLYIFYVAEVLWNISLRCVTFAYVVEYLFNDAKKISLAAV